MHNCFFIHITKFFIVFQLRQRNEPLTASLLAAATPEEQKQQIGEQLFHRINLIYPDMAGKITGMLLEIDNAELLHMLDSAEALKSKVNDSLYSTQVKSVAILWVKRWQGLMTRQPSMHDAYIIIIY